MTQSRITARSVALSTARSLAGALAALIGLGGVLAIASCGEKATTTAGGDSPQAETTAAGAMPANWKATDACSIVDKAKVAEALKIEVVEAQLGLVHEPGAADAGTSECVYIGKDGGSVARIMTRWSPINDNVQSSIDGARAVAAKTIKAFTDKPIEDVPGLGKAAFALPGGRSLTVFIDDARMITVSPEKVPEGASGKDIAIALAKQGGA